MTPENFTLYKLIVLYMLSKVSFPLTRAQVGDFMLEKEYTNFLTLQQAFAELQEAGLLSSGTMRNRTYLEITDEGRKTLTFFSGRIHHGIRDDVDQYLKEHGIRLRDEVSVRAAYHRSAGGAYVAELAVMEENAPLVSLSLTVPVEEVAAAICDNWQEKHREVYRCLTDMLF